MELLWHAVIFTAANKNGDHGDVFAQERKGPCTTCLFPDISENDHYPCPGTPTIADILQAVGALTVYAVDSLLMKRPRGWNHRRLGLADGAVDCASQIQVRKGCHSCVQPK